MLNYSKLKIPFTSFSQRINEFISIGKEFLTASVNSEQELNNFKSQRNNWRNDVKSFLGDSFILATTAFVAGFHNSSVNNQYHIPGTQKSILKSIEDAKNALQNNIRYLEFILKIVDVCDLIKGGDDDIILQRTNFTTKQKLDLLLEKLFILNDDSYYPIELLFSGNGIILKHSSETRELAKILENNNYISTVGGLGSEVYARISSNGCLYIEDILAERSINEVNKMSVVKNTQTSMEIFISHSNKDVEIAKELIELLRIALNLKTQDIRCTSVDGYRLPAGSSTDEQLKSEIHDSKILIGLISPASISSYYVLFELGARWGAKKPLIPLITNTHGVELLKGPLQGINALKAYEEAQLYQLVTDIANILQIESEPPASYQTHIKRLASATSNILNTEQTIENDTSSFNIDYHDANDVIREYCRIEWPDNYSMQLSCVKEQQEAVKILKKGKPKDISADDFILIRKKAQDDWPSNYSMRVHQEREEYEALRKLKQL